MTSTTQKKWLFWIGVALAFFLFLYVIRSVLLPFVLGMATAYILDPAADRLEKEGMSRGIATAMLTLAFFLAITLLFLLIAPLVAEQLAGLISAIPQFIAEFNRTYMPKLQYWLHDLPPDQVEGIKSAVADSSGALVKLSGEFIGNLFASGMTVLTVLSLVLITPVVSFYLLRDWDYMVAKFDMLLPRRHADVIREQLAIIDRTLAGFVRGQLNVCLLLGIFYAIGLSLVGLKFGFVIGLATGFLCIFPYVGMTVGLITGMSIALFQFDSPGPIAAVAAIFAVGQFIESNFVTPKLVGDKVGLHPVWVIFGMLAGAVLFGFAGVLLAIPITATLGVLIRFAIGQYMKSEYYEGSTSTKPKA